MYHLIAICMQFNMHTVIFYDFYDETLIFFRLSSSLTVTRYISCSAKIANAQTNAQKVAFFIE